MEATGEDLRWYKALEARVEATGGDLRWLEAL